jgi:hypothetical protein
VKYAYSNLLLFFFSVQFLAAQDGLEGIIVEKYYVSAEADNKGSMISGDLPVGSTTYRIYVDLKPGYRFQAAYGAPNHALSFESTAPFFNHIDAGTTHPNILPERTLGKDISLLDSWLSVGAAGENHLGVLKRYDNDRPDGYILWPGGFFMNHFEGEDYAIRDRDGLQRADKLPFPTFYQMDSALYYLGSSTKGNKFTVDNGAWACMGKGSNGVDSLTTNTVLIAQLTTAGDLRFHINLLIGAPNGTSQKYVWTKPDMGEWERDYLSFDSNTYFSQKKEKIEKEEKENQSKEKTKTKKQQPKSTAP